LILGSEGFKNTENSRAVKWGDRGFSQAILRAPKVGVHDLRNEIIYSNEQYSGKNDPVRDQTLIVAEVKDRVIKLASR
jgi:sigma-B regulation protein RsbU (phosphoserine phosphatase)